MAQSALIVRVPEAEACVAPLRTCLDPSAELGVPAHVTLLYPFMPPAQISDAVLARIRTVVAAAPAFAFRLASIGRFPGMLYLAPRPAAPFVALTARLAREFPMFPPYEGRYESVVPHLTVAQVDANGQRAAAAELLRALRRCGEIVSTCREVVLIENSAVLWRPLQTFALSAAVHADD